MQHFLLDLGNLNTLVRRLKGNVHHNSLMKTDSISLVNKPIWKQQNQIRNSIWCVWLRNVTFQKSQDQWWFPCVSNNISTTLNLSTGLYNCTNCHLKNHAMKKQSWRADSLFKRRGGRGSLKTNTQGVRHHNINISPEDIDSMTRTTSQFVAVIYGSKDHLSGREEGTFGGNLN